MGKLCKFCLIFILILNYVQHILGTLDSPLLHPVIQKRLKHCICVETGTDVYNVDTIKCNILVCIQMAYVIGIYAISYGLVQSQSLENQTIPTTKCTYCLAYIQEPVHSISHVDHRMQQSYPPSGVWDHMCTVQQSCSGNHCGSYFHSLGTLAGHRTPLDLEYIYTSTEKLCRL